MIQIRFSLPHWRYYVLLWLQARTRGERLLWCYRAVVLLLLLLILLWR